MGRRRAVWRPWDLIVCSLAGIILVVLETCGHLEERCHLPAERAQADCVKLQGMLLDFSQQPCGPCWLPEWPHSRLNGCCASGWACTAAFEIAAFEGPTATAERAENAHCNSETSGCVSIICPGINSLPICQYGGVSSTAKETPMRESSYSFL